MRKAEVQQQGRVAGVLEETDRQHYRFTYAPGYVGEPVSLALPVRPQPYEFDRLPPAFEGLLPEGQQLEALLRQYKVDRHDLFTQLLLVGADVVGALTITEAP
jgi:serine/threonine-protein kinase HipA